MGNLDSLFDEVEKQSSLDSLFDEVEAQGSQFSGMGDVKAAEFAAGNQQPGTLERIARNIAPLSVSANQAPRQAPRSYDASRMPSSFADFPGSRQDPAMGLAPGLDALSLPSRVLATARGQSMSDPGAYLLRPEAEASVANAAQKNAENPWEGRAPNSFADFGQNAFSAPAEVALQAASDPLVIASALPKTAQTVTKGLIRGAEALNAKGGALAAEASGVPQEALRAYGSKQGREKLAANFGREKQIGDEFLEKIDNPDPYLPEADKINETLSKMGDVSVQGPIDAMEAAKAQPIAGRMSPAQASGNAVADPWIDYVRGGPVPENLDKKTTLALKRLDQAKQSVSTVKPMAEADIKAASRAEKAKESLVNKASKSAAMAGKTKKEFIKSSDLADRNLMRYGGQRNESGVIAESYFEEAKDMAAKARSAAEDARAKSAIGEISKADLEAALAEEARASENLLITSTARKIYNGQPLKEVAQEFSKGGMPSNEIRDILVKARSRAQSIQELPSQTIPATDFRRMRAQLDVPIDFAQEGADIKKRVLMAGRTSMKNALIDKAIASGNPEYIQWMAKYHDKLDKLDRIKELIGKNANTRERRVQQFIDNLFGKNSEYKSQLVADLDEVFGSNFSERAKYADMAASLGPEGKPSLLPRQPTGAALKAGIYLNVVPVLGQIATIATASPAIAARFTLPTLQALEDGLKAANIMLTPRARSAAKALSGKAVSAEQRVRLAQIVMDEIRAGHELDSMQNPSNVVPFRKKSDESKVQYK